MIARRSGRILNLGSTAGFQAGPGMATYYATKAFVNSFTEALVYELRGTGVAATVSLSGRHRHRVRKGRGHRGIALFHLGTTSAEFVARPRLPHDDGGQADVTPRLARKLGLQLLRIGSRGQVRGVTARINQIEAPRRGGRSATEAHLEADRRLAAAAREAEVAQDVHHAGLGVAAARQCRARDHRNRHGPRSSIVSLNDTRPLRPEPGGFAARSNRAASAARPARPCRRRRARGCPRP